MAHEEKFKKYVEWLEVFTAKQFAKVAHSDDIGSNINSAQAIGSRHLKPEVQMGRLKKTGSVYHKPNLTGTGKHALMITDATVMVVSKFDAVVFREHRIKEVALQPDLMILAKDGNRRCILIVEIMNKETEVYYKQKKSTWGGWKDSIYYLSNLFGVDVPYFHLCTFGRNVTGVLTLEEAINRMESE